MLPLLAGKSQLFPPMHRRVELSHCNGNSKDGASSHRSTLNRLGAIQWHSSGTPSDSGTVASGRALKTGWPSGVRLMAPRASPRRHEFDTHSCHVHCLLPGPLGRPGLDSKWRACLGYSDCHVSRNLADRIWAHWELISIPQLEKHVQGHNTMCPMMGNKAVSDMYRKLN